MISASEIDRRGKTRQTKRTSPMITAHLQALVNRSTHIPHTLPPPPSPHAFPPSPPPPLPSFPSFVVPLSFSPSSSEAEGSEIEKRRSQSECLNISLQAQRPFSAPPLTVAAPLPHCRLLRGRTFTVAPAFTPSPVPRRASSGTPLPLSRAAVPLLLLLPRHHSR